MSFSIHGKHNTYELDTQQILGRGAMGVVLRGTIQGTSKACAVKCIMPQPPHELLNLVNTISNSGEQSFIGDDRENQLNTLDKHQTVLHAPLSVRDGTVILKTLQTISPSTKSSLISKKRTNNPTVLLDRSPQGEDVVVVPPMAQRFLNADLMTQYEQIISSLAREADILAHLDHPSIPKFIDYITVPNQTQPASDNHYLVMELVEGKNLGKWLEAGQRPFPELQVLHWALNTIDALQYCHDQGIYHLDVKPDNIIIRDNAAVLIDFGIARALNQNVIKAGTKPYMSPEINYGVPTERSDIYSLGATLYELLSFHHLPTVDEQRNTSIGGILRSLNPDVSLEMANAIEQAVTSESSHRYLDLTEFRKALKVVEHHHLYCAEFADILQYAQTRSYSQAELHNKLNKLYIKAFNSQIKHESTIKQMFSKLLRYLYVNLRLK